MSVAKEYVVWFVTGSQHLYGPDTLAKVAAHSQQIASALDADTSIPVRIAFKPVLTNSEDILGLCRQANTDDSCVGVMTWMHTFSPAKMWIAGLSELQKPLLHLHTQFNRDIPWETIDMDFMNLNQAAHGDREFGFIGARMGIRRKVIVGHWEDPSVCQEIGQWSAVAVGATVGRRLKIARFGDNMRDVAVTEGDKVQAQIKFGWSISGFGVGDLVNIANGFTQSEVDGLVGEYRDQYEMAQVDRVGAFANDRVAEQARMELALRSFLKSGSFNAFTTTFEDLNGLPQLPGLAVQRLMASGFGFAGEGDWKTAALVRVMKVMASGQPRGTSFMEDYTYHLEPGNELVLGSHMLEICPSIAASKPRVEVHPLGIGGKADPARLVFDGATGPAINVSLIDLGTRFRLIINEVDAVASEREMPALPVARVLWRPKPSLRTAAESWIYAGGAHHTCFSFAVNTEQMTDWAEMVGIECVVIDRDTKTREFRNTLRWSDAVWRGRE